MASDTDTPAMRTMPLSKERQLECRIEAIERAAVHWGQRVESLEGTVRAMCGAVKALAHCDAYWSGLPTDYKGEARYILKQAGLIP